MTNKFLKPAYKLCLILSLLLLWTNGLYAHDEAKIAVVNLEYVAAYSPEGKKLQEKLEKFQNEIKAEIEVQQNKMKQIRQKILDGSKTLSDEKLNELNKQFEDLQIAMRRFSDDKQREGQKMQSESLKQIELSLEPVFKQIKEEEGYDLILNNVSGVVILASKRINITQKVIDLLNK